MVQKSKKVAGRPREFDLGEALERAMNVFWLKGYDGSSLDDLQNAMGISRPSLYHAFGDKRSLFLKCLTHYSQNVAGKCLLCLQREKDLEVALTAFFLQSVSNVATTNLGCMVACVATSVDDVEVRQFLSTSSEQVEQFLAQRFVQAIEDGQLRPDFPVTERARRAFDLMVAMGFRGRAGARPEDLSQDAHDAARLLLS